MGGGGGQGRGAGGGGCWEWRVSRSVERQKEDMARSRGLDLWEFSVLSEFGRQRGGHGHLIFLFSEGHHLGVELPQ